MMEARNRNRNRNRKRKIRHGRYIVRRSCRILSRLPPETSLGGSFLPPQGHVRVGDTIDVFSLLPHSLISNHNPVMVRTDEKLRGKTILIYMLPLTLYHIPGGFRPDTLSLIAEFKERDFVDVEVVFVAVHRGPAFLDKCALNRFNDFFSKMTSWLAVPFSDQVASRRIQEAWLPLFSSDGLASRSHCAQQSVLDPSWAIFDPAGTVLLTSPDIAPNLFSSYGIAELIPRTRNILPVLVEKRRIYGSVSAHVLNLLSWSNLEDQTFLSGITNLDYTLLGTHFLLSRDGSQVPLSSLKDKVVGLYFCNHNSTKPSRIESIKKTYAQAIALGYDFEIVQINFSYSFYVVDKPCSENENFNVNVPWLTLPYLHSCYKRLIRIFSCYNYNSKAFDNHTFTNYDEGDRLVIINPHEPDAMGIRYDRHGASIIDALGVEAYPFTRLGLVEAERERKRQELRLELILAPGGASLLRPRGKGKSKSLEQVPLSQLLGKRVALVFAMHSALKSCKFVTSLESAYLKQGDDDAFEVVYISIDEDEAGFEDCAASTPWLVHPYSREFGRTWRERIFQILPPDSKGSIVGFGISGEFVRKFDRLEPLHRSVIMETHQDLLFRPPSSWDDRQLSDVIYRYGLSKGLKADLLHK